MCTIDRPFDIGKHLVAFLFSIALVLVGGSIAFSQETSLAPQGPTLQQPGPDDAMQHLRLAISSPDYPVTPGDHYRLAYYQTADTLVATDVLVDGDSVIDLGVFGRIDAKGMTFTALKRRVENLIAKSYTRSLPSLRILAPGVFGVSVKGEVDHSQYLTAWGLTRLSDIVNRARGRYSSLRTVEVQSRDGSSRRYDLLKALRLGDASQDPYVHPGDTIYLYPAGRTVQLSGEVRHPGRYELLPNEGLRVLIEQFGGGTTADANLNRVRIERTLVPRPHAEYVKLPQAFGTQIDLANGDTVVVTPLLVSRFVVWFEGAVSPTRISDGTISPGAPAATGPLTDAAGTEPIHRPVQSRISCTITDGETLSDAVAQVKSGILPTADLKAATLRRLGSDTTVPVDLVSLLSNPNSSSDIVLQPNDTIFIPSMPHTVSVFGAVMAPGFFEYQPGLGAQYYISMAGGIDPERNGNGEYQVNEPNGKHRSPSDPVMPGDRIYVPLNSSAYRFEHSAPLVVTILGAILNTATFIFLLTR